MTLKRWAILIIGIAVVSTLLWRIAPQLGNPEERPPEFGELTGTVSTSASRDAQAPESATQSPGPMTGGALSLEQLNRDIEMGRKPEEFRDFWLEWEAGDPIFADYMVISYREPAEWPLPPCETTLETPGGDLCWELFGHNPYLTYDAETLRSLAPTDATAAAALAYVLLPENLEERLAYALYATRMTGKGATLFPAIRDLTGQSSSRDDLPEMLQVYAVYRVAEGFGLPANLSYDVRASIQALGLSDDEFERAVTRTNTELWRAVSAVTPVELHSSNSGGAE